MSSRAEPWTSDLWGDPAERQSPGKTEGQGREWEWERFLLAGGRELRSRPAERVAESVATREKLCRPLISELFLNCHFNDVSKTKKS